MMEAQLIVAMVAQKYRLRSVPGHPVEPDATFFLRPRHGVFMKVDKKDMNGLVPTRLSDDVEGF